MFSPVVSHVPCALDHQRRIAEATAEAVARSARPRGALARLLGRRGGTARTRRALPPRATVPAGEDAWAALRF
ncbi:MAG TPA: hypothetical protein VNO79_10300 [Actinomycetota bacterium]|nr:hypothetical protein [Actinomycetota bacterium]